MGEFHYGRYDVKFESLQQLRDGRFVIIEVNGAGSEAIQFWDPRLSMAQAFRGVFRKQRELFALGDMMRARGIRPIGPSALITAFVRQRWLIKRYAPSN
jgi:exosome complex RNA-binding protein Csl4